MDMPIEPMYFSVFFIEGLPSDYLNSEYKRISQAMFNNLIDGMPDKTVVLKPRDEKEGAVYSITSVSSFGIENSVDNHLFVVCNVKKM